MGVTLGVVLAGGRGTRLGRGVPKAAVALAGTTLLDRAVERLAPLCDEVVVAAPDDVGLGAHEGRRVRDAEGAAGPLAGLVAGLAARPHTRALVLGVDFPLVEPRTLRALLERLATSGRPVVMTRPGGVPQPLIAALDASVGPALGAALARGERSVARALAPLAPCVLDDAALAGLGGSADEFLNVNTAADLEAAARALAVRAAGAR